MLEQLHIKNVALIRECELSFGEGLNILTGETGAGKSMVIDSLQFALGGRAGKDFLRNGEKNAVVEALFGDVSPALSETLEENGIEAGEDGELLIRRSMTANGKSVCRINGSAVTVGMLRELSGELMDFYGQHEHQSLLNPAKHILLLDRFCGEGFRESFQKYKACYQRVKELEKELEKLLGDEAEREQRLDILNFQKDELEQAGLRLGEEEELSEQKKRLGSMERLIRLTGESVQVLYDGKEPFPSVCDQLGDALEKLREAAEIDSGLSGFRDTLENAYADIEDTARELRHEAEAQEAEPELLEEIEERLQTIYKCKRKYGGSVEAALEFYDKTVKELDFLSNSAETAEKLTKERDAEKKTLTELAEALSAFRKKTAETVSVRVEEALHDMEMKQARFSVEITEKPLWGSDGKDKVEFMISANGGEELKPLAKIASGGEMSRVMLALKTVLVDADDIGTFVFDEIDTGVSGRTAQKVGEKMRFLGEKRQILCITHLPQIAALADSHFLIEKEVQEGEATTEVSALEGEASVREVARLMGGTEITEAAMAAARELIRGR